MASIWLSMIKSGLWEVTGKFDTHILSLLSATREKKIIDRFYDQIKYGFSNLSLTLVTKK